MASCHRVHQNLVNLKDLKIILSELLDFHIVVGWSCSSPLLSSYQNDYFGFYWVSHQFHCRSQPESGCSMLHLSHNHLLSVEASSGVQWSFSNIPTSLIIALLPIRQVVFLQFRQKILWLMLRRFSCHGIKEERVYLYVYVVSFFIIFSFSACGVCMKNVIVTLIMHACHHVKEID